MKTGQKALSPLIQATLDPTDTLNGIENVAAVNVPDDRTVTLFDTGNVFFSSGCIECLGRFLVHALPVIRIREFFAEIFPGRLGNHLGPLRVLHYISQDHYYSFRGQAGPSLHSEAQHSAHPLSRELDHLYSGTSSNPVRTTGRA